MRCHARALGALARAPLAARPGPGRGSFARPPVRLRLTQTAAADAPALAAAAPGAAAREKRRTLLGDLSELCKARLSAFVALTGAAGYVAHGGAAAIAEPEFFALSVGTFLASGAVKVAGSGAATPRAAALDSMRTNTTSRTRETLI